MQIREDYKHWKEVFLKFMRDHAGALDYYLANIPMSVRDAVTASLERGHTTRLGNTQEERYREIVKGRDVNKEIYGADIEEKSGRLIQVTADRKSKPAASRRGEAVTGLPIEIVYWRESSELVAIPDYAPSRDRIVSNILSGLEYEKFTE